MDKENSEKPAAIRCAHCKKKIKLVNFTCTHCNNVFCLNHQLSTSHLCVEITKSKDPSVDKLRCIAAKIEKI